MDRSGNACAEARAEVFEYRSQMKVLKWKMAEFKYIHSATIDSLKFESDKFKNEVAGQRQAVEKSGPRPRQLEQRPSWHVKSGANDLVRYISSWVLGVHG